MALVAMHAVSYAEFTIDKLDATIPNKVIIGAKERIRKKARLPGSINISGNLIICHKSVKNFFNL